MNRIVTLMIAALTLLTPACQKNDSQMKSVAPTKGEPLGLNDVSVLFPYIDLPELLTRSPKVADIQADGSRFIPEDTFAVLQGMMIDDNELRQGLSGREGRGASDPRLEKIFFQRNKDLFILASVRIDPCANQLAEDKNFTDACHYELRLVWQPIHQRDTMLRTEDANIHSIYGLSHDEFMALVAGIQSIKRQAAEPMALSLALGPHPIILREGPQSKTFDRLVALFSSYANLDRLKSIAALGDTAPNLEGHWPMLAVDYVDGRLIPRPLEHVKDSEKNPGQEFFVQRIGGAFASLSAPSPEGRSNPKLESFEPANVQSFLKEVQKIGDPRVHGLGNTDCGGCHMSHTTIAGMRLPEGVDGLVDGYYANPRWNLEVVNPSERKLTSLQIFSFFPHNYAIAPRAVFESAVVADRVQALLDRQP